MSASDKVPLVQQGFKVTGRFISVSVATQPRSSLTKYIEVQTQTREISDPLACACVAGENMALCMGCDTSSLLNMQI